MPNKDVKSPIYDNLEVKLKTPVSYTHLDVYRRQVLNIPVIRILSVGKMRRLCLRIRVKDVYKRQVAMCTNVSNRNFLSILLSYGETDDGWKYQ